MYHSHFGPRSPARPRASVRGGRWAAWQADFPLAVIVRGGHSAAGVLTDPVAGHYRVRSAVTGSLNWSDRDFGRP